MTMMTLFTDASYCSRTNAAGWGAWAKRDHLPPIYMHGPLRKNIENSTDAEVAALIMAVRELRQRQLFGGIDAIMIQSDCTMALGMLMFVCEGSRQSLHPDGAEVRPYDVTKCAPVIRSQLEHVADVLSIRRIQVIIRHVRGHTGGEGRQWVNRKCDQMAKREMRTVRAEIQANLQPVSLEV